MIIQDCHPVYNPSEGKDFHGDDADCYGHFHPVRIVPLCCVPVEGDHRGIDPVQDNAYDRQKCSPPRHPYFFVPNAVGKEECREEYEPEHLEQEPVSVRSVQVLPGMSVSGPEKSQKKVGEERC